MYCYHIQVHLLVTNGNTLPQFTEQNYVVHISENKDPPQFLIDIDTTEELLGVPVQYSILPQLSESSRLRRSADFNTGRMLFLFLLFLMI